MKKDQVQIGQTYTAKITDKVVPVRIDAEHKDGGWVGTNTQTNRKVRIKSAQKLRGRTNAATSPTNTTAKQSGGKPARKKLTAAERKEVQANARAKQTMAPDGAPTEAKPAKKTTKTKAAASSAASSGGKKMSLIDAAIEVLRKAKKPMNCKEMVNAVLDAKLWTPGTGKTPHATLYSAILRDLNSETPRFEKVDRGQFTVAKGA